MTLQLGRYHHELEGIQTFGPPNVDDCPTLDIYITGVFDDDDQT